MATTKQKLEELQEIVDAGPSGPTVDFYLPNLSEDAIWKLGKWSEQISDYAPAFGDWLHGVVVEEIYRRASENPVEARIPILPVDWSNTELSAALQTVFGMMRANGLRELDEFLSSLALTVVALVADRLTEEEK